VIQVRYKLVRCILYTLSVGRNVGEIKDQHSWWRLRAVSCSKRWTDRKLHQVAPTRDKVVRGAL